MPRRNKRTRHCLAAIKKRWDNKSKLDIQASDTEYDEPSFDTTWTEDNDTMDDQFDIQVSDTEYDKPTTSTEDNDTMDNQFVQELKEVKPSVFEELIKQARQPGTWATKGRKRFYAGSAESTLCNKRAALKKAAAGSSKITDWFSGNPSINNKANSTYDKTDLLFDEAVNSSDDDDDDHNKFNLASLDALLAKKPEDVRLRTVSQFLHLVEDQGFSKLSASELLARSVNRGPWHARVIRS